MGHDTDLESWPFTGRADELRTGRAALAEGRGVLVFGEGGVGKSRLARELVAAWSSGGRVTGTPGAEGVPYGAWSHLLPAGWDEAVGAAEAWRVLAERLRRPDGRIRLLVDDVQWLDDGSVALLHHLVVAHGAIVVATHRTGAPVGPSVTALWKDGHATRIDLAPLSVGELDALLEAVLDGPVEPLTVRRLHQRTGGNVVLARQLAEDALSDGSLRLVHGAWVQQTPTPPSPRLVDLVADRIEALATDERAGVEVLAVAGPTPIELAFRCLTSAVIEQMRGRGLVVTEEIGLRRLVRMADPLMGEVLLDRLDADRRRAIVARLVAVYGDAADLDPADALSLALWRVEGGVTVDPGDAVRAADVALGRSDPAAAERLAAAAIEGGAGPAAAIRLGEALWHQHRHSEAEAALGPVGDALAELDDDLRFRFATARARVLSTELGRLDDAIAVLEATIGPMADAGPRWALEAHLSFLLADCGRLAAAAPLAEAGLARRDRDEPSALTAFVAGGLVRTLRGRSQDTLELCDEMVPIALRHLEDRPEGIGWIAAAQMLATYVRGDLHAAADLSLTIEQMVADEADVTLRAAALMYRGLVLSDQGQLATALRLLRKSAALHEVDNRRGYQAWCFAIMSRAHSQRGELDAAREALLAARRHLWPGGQVFTADVDVATIWVEAIGGDRQAASRTLAGAVARAEGEGASTFTLRLRHEAIRAGLPAGPHVVPFARAAADEQSLWAGAQADHVSALAADDGAGLVSVGARYSDLGIHLQAAEAFTQGTEAHRRAGSSTLAARARRLADDQRSRCEDADTPGLRSVAEVSGLTGRELDVATRAAGGQTNREIADALAISVRTAETHLQRVFAKLGVHRRADLSPVLAPPRPGPGRPTT